MNRSSGMVIFSSGYTICFVAILCCMHIKYDARELRQDLLISPEIYPEKQEVAEPIQYVLMNPIKKDYMIDLAEKPQQPNILIASLPTNEPLVQNNPANRKISGLDARKIVAMHLDESTGTNVGAFSIHDETLSDVTKPETKLETPQLVEADSQSNNGWGVFGLIGQTVRQNPFSLASSSKSVSSNTSANANDCAEMSNTSFHQPDSHVSFGSNALAAEPFAPHISIANDPALIELRDSIRILNRINVEPDVIQTIEEQLEQIAEHGSLDAGLCEACLYRILDQSERLPASEFDEDSRLIESIRGQVIEQINNWIDQLNGMMPEDQEPQREMDEMDYQRLNTALKSFLFGKLF